jgi:hypothetical protein
VWGTEEACCRSAFAAARSPELTSGGRTGPLASASFAKSWLQPLTILVPAIQFNGLAKRRVDYLHPLRFWRWRRLLEPGCVSRGEYDQIRDEIVILRAVLERIEAQVAGTEFRASFGGICRSRWPASVEALRFSALLALTGNPAAAVRAAGYAAGYVRTV